MDDKKMINGAHGGVSFEIHYGVEKNSRSLNRSCSIGLFFPGSGDIEADYYSILKAGEKANQVVSVLLNALENRERYVSGLPLMDVETGETE